MLGPAATPLLELVVRLRFNSNRFDIPSDAEPSGDGVSKPPSGGTTSDWGRDAEAASESAIVGAALDGEEPIAKGGRVEYAPLEGRDEVLDRSEGGLGRRGEEVLIVRRAWGEGD